MLRQKESKRKKVGEIKRGVRGKWERISAFPLLLELHVITADGSWTWLTQSSLTRNTSALPWPTDKLLYTNNSGTYKQKTSPRNRMYAGKGKPCHLDWSHPSPPCRHCTEEMIPKENLIYMWLWMLKLRLKSEQAWRGKEDSRWCLCSVLLSQILVTHVS